MSTQSLQRSASTSSGRRHFSGMTVAVAAVLAAALGLLAGYLVFGPVAGDQANAEVEALLDDYWSAAAAGDADAVFALLSEDPQFFQWDLPEQEAELRAAISGWTNLMVERVGEPVVLETPGSYVIAQRGSFAAHEILYLIRTVDEDGGLRIDAMSPYYSVG